MTDNDFNHLMNRIKGLSPEQAQRLRQQLDKQLDKPKTPTPKPSPKTAKRTRAATPKKKALTRDVLGVSPSFKFFLAVR
jgi:hypothetical protein